jgi:transcriptional regulator
VPAHFAMDDEAVRELLRHHGAADLVTATSGGLIATMLPFVHDPDAGEHGALLGHVARTNDQWRADVVGEALVIVRGPDAYVSPSWYASKAEHGRVVPTWNYLTAHVYGRLVVHDDPTWVEALVRRLTAKHEAAMPRPWTVDQAPPAYVAGQLRAIVGIEVQISRIEAKAKLSQNRPEADVEGVIAGLEACGERATADAVRHAAADAGRSWRRPTVRADPAAPGRSAR